MIISSKQQQKWTKTGQGALTTIQQENRIATRSRRECKGNERAWTPGAKTRFYSPDLASAAGGPSKNIAFAPPEPVP